MFREWTSPAAVFQILKKLSRGQPCDITGIEDYRHLDASGGIQWPLAQSEGARLWSQTQPQQVGTVESAAAGASHTAALRERRLFSDGKFFTPDGKAKFLFDPPRPVAEPTDAEFPFVMLSGRGTSAQWHTNTRTGKSAVLRTLYPANAYVEIHPDDAARLRIEPNSTIALVSRRARVEITALVTPTVQPGHVFVPMHYDVTNRLTYPQFDPHSRQPSYKYCAVRLENIEQ